MIHQSRPPSSIALWSSFDADMPIVGAFGGAQGWNEVSTVHNSGAGSFSRVCVMSSGSEDEDVAVRSSVQDGKEEPLTEGVSLGLHLLFFLL
ncbi:hypothetical protein QTP70_001158 [Hemibagrus guttatus]|uniref:Uncharacterized protein n=1 Tax=Hemibagrus guttatus TaxID=175788 RepID=A0AAE0QV11_9TELE|nr:hypothetical protein QTP70_001158 [Hemibagrus guttatus]